MRLIILILILLVANSAFADTFTVTSTSDSGSGTLRKAIQKAADNGIGQTDNIAFSLVGSLKQDKTITVLSPLPNLTSYLIIDGSTQTGQNLSVNGTKVAVEFDNQQPNKALLYTEQSSNIEIYGLDFHCASHNTYCFLFDGVTHLVFGAAGKGNVITGFNKGIYNFNQEHINRDFVIQSNFFGVDESGTVLDNNLMDHAIFVYSVYDMTIGGDQKGDANTICAVYVSASDSYQDVRQTGFTKIINNGLKT